MYTGELNPKVKSKQKMKWWKKMLLILIAIPIALVVLLLLVMTFSKSAPNDYIRRVETGGVIENAYMQKGDHPVGIYKEAAEEPLKQHILYYPKELETAEKTYPVILCLNGTGVPASKYPAVFKHFASWGFLVLGNEDPSTGFGVTADKMMDHLLSLNENENSIFYHKIDWEHIGLVGHSQGGAGVFSALTVADHAGDFHAAVALSPTHEETAHLLGWQYELEQVHVPVAIFAGTESEFETEFVIPLDKMESMYEKIPSDRKLMARRTGADHGQMLYSANAYALAWLCWQLMEDETAAEAFLTENAELFQNPLYQNQKICISE